MPYYKGRLRTHSFKGIIDIRLKWSKNVLPNTVHGYCLIHDVWTTNYYHWITQSLVRLLLIRKSNPNATLILPDNHRARFHAESLQVMGESDWQTVDAGKVFYKVEQLNYPTHDIQIGDYNDDIIRELSVFLRSKIETPSPGKLKLFIARKGDGRRIINEVEVFRVLNSFGFRIISFEDMSFVEQMTLAASASILAGVHGAGLTNMLFMPPGSKVLELTSQVDGEQYYYYTLSNALRHSYFYQYCLPDDPAKTLQEAHIVVDLDELTSNLTRMTNEM